MTGAAVLWCVVAVLFGLASFYTICKTSYEIMENGIREIKVLVGILLVVIVSSTVTFLCAYECQKCYDVNFAVAMKNINYTRTTEMNTNIEMNYQDVTKEQEK